MFHLGTLRLASGSWHRAALIVAMGTLLGAVHADAATLALGTGSSAAGGRALVPVTYASSPETPTLTRVTVTVGFNPTLLTFRSVQVGSSIGATEAASVAVQSRGSGTVTFEIRNFPLNEGTLA